MNDNDKLFLRIDHIGIAVTNEDVATEIFNKLLGKEPYKKEIVSSENVSTSFYSLGESKIELVSTLPQQDSSISKYIQKKGEGIHHIAIEVSDIYLAMKTAQEKGFILLSDDPKIGADQKLICFLHPKSTNSVLIEFCQSIKS